MKFSELVSNKVHIIGINGIGMSALAIYLKKNNINVTGSDIARNANTVNLEKYKIPVFIGHKSSNIKDRDIIFYSSAIKNTVSYTHLRAHETSLHLVCRLLLEKKNNETSLHLVCRLLPFPYGVVGCFFFLMIRRPPRSTQGVSSAASDVYKRQGHKLRTSLCFSLR